MRGDGDSPPRTLEEVHTPLVVSNSSTLFHMIQGTRHMIYSATTARRRGDVLSSDTNGRGVNLRIYLLGPRDFEAFQKSAPIPPAPEAFLIGVVAEE